MPHLHYGDGIGLGFLSCTEIKSKNPSLMSMQYEMFSMVQCSHLIRNRNPSRYPYPSPEM